MENRIKTKKLFNRKALSSILSLLIVFVGFSIPKTVDAQTYDNYIDNIHVHPFFALSYKYEKTIDLEKLGKEGTIPEASFQYNLNRIDDADFDKFGIGKVYHPQPFMSQMPMNKYKIIRGEMEPGTKSKTISTVTFSPNDLWDGKDEFGNNSKFHILSKKMDNAEGGRGITDFIIKYCWGRIETKTYQDKDNENVINTLVLTQKMTPEQLNLYDKGYIKSGWPRGVSPYCFYEVPKDQPIDVNHGLSLLNYNCSEIKIYRVLDFNRDPATTFYAVGVNPGTVGYLTHASKNEKGDYTSISKALLTYQDACLMKNYLDEFSHDSKNVDKYYDESDVGKNGQQPFLIFRYYITETADNDDYKADNDYLILDYYPNPGTEGESYRIFNNLDQADEYYSGYPDYADLHSGGGFSDFPTISNLKALPRAAFINKKDKGSNDNITDPSVNEKDDDETTGSEDNSSENPYSMDLPVHINWIGKEPSKDVNVILNMDGKPTTSELSLKKQDNWKGAFKNLPTMDEDREDKEITYTVSIKGAKDNKINIDGVRYSICIAGTSAKNGGGYTVTLKELNKSSYKKPKLKNKNVIQEELNIESSATKDINGNDGNGSSNHINDDKSGPLKGKGGSPMTGDANDILLYFAVAVVAILLYRLVKNKGKL